MENSRRVSTDFTWPPPAEGYEAADFHPDEQTALVPGQPPHLVATPRVPAALAPQMTSARSNHRWLAGAVVLLSIIVIGESIYLVAGRSREATPKPQRSVKASGDAGQSDLRGSLPTRGETPTDISSSTTTPTATSGLTRGVAAETASNASKNVATTVAESSEPGWVSIALPFRADVFEQGRFVATSDAKRIAFAPGRHTLDLVNDSLNYRSHQTVRIATSKATVVRPTLPLATLNVNANPWAEVFIDGKSMGETPLGNVQLAVGAHQVTLRHPVLAEETQTVTVVAGKANRLSVNLQK